MRIERITRKLEHKLNVAKFETIVPTLELTAVLEEGDSPEQALKELSAILEKDWSMLALTELREVRKRRGARQAEDDSLPQLMQHFKEKL